MKIFRPILNIQVYYNIEFEQNNIRQHSSDVTIFLKMDTTVYFMQFVQIGK